MNKTLTFVESGAPSGGFTKEFAREVYDGQPVFHHRNFDEFFLTTSLAITGMNRWEYVVTDDSGKIQASMSIYREYDLHVGDCLSVLCAFSLKHTALIGGYRAMFSIAKENQVPFVAYTKSTGFREFSLKYKEVNLCTTPGLEAGT